MTERSRKQQVKTIKQNQGEDFFKNIGSMGGNASPTKFNSNSGRSAANIRWERQRAEQNKKLRKENENNGHQVQTTEDK